MSEPFRLVGRRSQCDPSPYLLGNGRRLFRCVDLFRQPLDIQEANVFSVALNEVTAKFYIFTHKY